MKKMLLILTLLVSSVSANAFQDVGRFGLGIGDDSEVKIFYAVSNTISIKYGFNINHLDVIKKSTADYSGKIQVHRIGLRKYLGDAELYNWFLDFEYETGKVVYTGNTSNQDYDREIIGGYTGLEYRIDYDVSVDARLGVEFYNTDYETYKDKGKYFPTTNLSLNYYF